jgi:arsenite-transporting ATPase
VIRRSRSELAADALIASLPAITLVVGKGGVGKTTCAAGVAVRFQEADDPALLLSTDPAGALGTLLGVPLADGEAHAIDGRPGLLARQLDAVRERRSFLARWRETIVTILDRGTYLDTDDIEGLVDAAFPGADEIFAMLALAELVVAGAGTSFPAGSVNAQRLVVDTAPTGHTLRLLALPETFEAMVALLDAMQSKHRFMVGALTRRYRADAADRFIQEMRKTITALRQTLADPARAAAIIVARAEPVVVAETSRYAEALRALDVRVAAVVINALIEDPDAVTREALAALADMAGDAPCLSLPRWEPAPQSLEEVARLMHEFRPMPRTRTRSSGKTKHSGPKGWHATRSSKRSLSLGGAPRATDAAVDRLLRTLTVVGGKGGVGKTTISTALAIHASISTTAPVLLVSTDPAPSIRDALGIPDPAWARTAAQSVFGVERLFAWQMDASLAFAELRDRYRGRIDDVFEALVGRGLDAAHDRAILRDLLALAPPGIDELYALASLGETLDERRYGHIIVDPAPTGHLLRLLEMPALALEWCHRLMRMILKYKDVVALGEAAEELLAFSKRTRQLDALLRDPQRAAVVLVTLDEPLVRAESLRLASALKSAGITISGVIANRVQRDASTASALPLDALPQLAAPVSRVPLVSTGVIRDWMREWWPLTRFQRS